jgi:predicted alpha/beta superfamily hydrolase
MSHLPARQATLLATMTALLSGFAQTAQAQDRGDPSWDQLVVNSRALGRRQIYVATPSGYSRGRVRYPVLVLMDADGGPMFRLGIAQAEYLADNGDNIPPMIVVGIVNGADRIHDMTPPATGSSVAEFKTAGGASAFADFLLGEALPAVRAKYRTLETTVLAGHSAAGLFALDVAASRLDKFQGIIAMDPAIWFNDGNPARLYADAIGRSSSAARVFAGHGGLSADIDVATTEFAARLDARPSPTVAFAHRRYPDDSHSMVPLSALPDGLRFVFEPVAIRHQPIAKLDGNMDPAAVLAALTASEASYAVAARSLRLPEVLPENAIDRVGRFALNTLKDPDLAIRVFQRNVAARPDSARALGRLADGYIAKDDRPRAIAELKKAIALAPLSPSELPADARSKLRELERK